MLTDRKTTQTCSEPDNARAEKVLLRSERVAFGPATGRARATAHDVVSKQLVALQRLLRGGAQTDLHRRVRGRRWPAGVLVVATALAVASPCGAQPGWSGWQPISPESDRDCAVSIRIRKGSWNDYAKEWYFFYEMRNTCPERAVLRFNATPRHTSLEYIAGSKTRKSWLLADAFNGAAFIRWEGPTAPTGVTEITFPPAEPRIQVARDAGNVALDEWKTSIVGALAEQDAWTKARLPSGWSPRLFTFGIELNAASERARNLHRLMQGLTSGNLDVLRNVETSTRALRRETTRLAGERREIRRSWCEWERSEAARLRRPVRRECRLTTNR